MKETFTYDNLGRLSLIDVKDNGISVLKTSVTYKAGTGESDTTGKIDIWNVRRYDTGNEGASSGHTLYTYEYDEKGRITSVQRGSYTVTYQYDEKGQLTRENNQFAGKTWVYTYDNGGNILTKKEYAYTAGTLGTLLSTKSYTYSDSTWKDLLTSYDGTAYTYDNSGNLLSDGTWTYTWEHGRQLAGMSKSGTNITFGYDAEGKRISKTVNGVKTEYHYAGDKLTEIVKGSETVYIDYDVLGPCAVEYNGVRYYCTRNAQGNIDVITDASGTNVTVYRYDAWGNTFSKTGTMSSTLGSLNPLRYRGYVYDEETGLYYLGTRYYSPKLGRFINADGYVSTGQGLLGSNMYAYCNNDPVDHLDSDGEWANLVIGALVGGIVGGITAAISSINNTGTVNWASVAIGTVSGALGGLIGATGLPAGVQASLSGIISAGANIADQRFVQGKKWNEINYLDAAVDGLISAGASLSGSLMFKSNMDAAKEVMERGANRIVDGLKNYNMCSHHFETVFKRGVKLLNLGQ